MARIAGVNLPNQKRLEIGLTYIYGIGQSTARKVAAELGLSPDTKIKDLTDDEVTKLRTYIDGQLEVEGDLRRERPEGHGARPAEGRGLRQGPGLRPRDRDPLAPGRWPRDPRRQGRHAAGP